MDLQYGVNVSNKFDITSFNEILDSGKTKKAVEGEKPKLGSNKQNTKKSTPHTETKDKKNDQNTNKKEVQKDAPLSERSNRGGRGNRDGRDKESRDNKENDGERNERRGGFRKPRDNVDNRGGDENVPLEFREKPEGSRFNRFDGDNDRGRGRGRGRGGFRGNRGRGGFGEGRGGGGGGFGAPFERSGKRDFDRHSGSDKTGVKAVDKREGFGKRNWGSFKDDIKMNMNEESVPQESETAENWNQNEENVEPQETSGDPAPGTTEAVNEEDAQPKQMTLKEYRASQGKNRLRSQFQIRKAGEGVDGSQWKEGTKIKKSVNNPANPPKPTTERRRKNSESEEEESDDDHEERKKKNKNTLNIEITFNDNNRRGGRGNRRGRGPGRGFYRGNSPRGGGRGGGDRKYRDTAPRVDDEKDFPSLVKSAA
ncbi:hypothetical protein LOTGIDRAFT_234584 [Lottia gigantea]|uniref:Hyaluronan/mRNA-binding protein domain-containing protein n=1 Tax=Lottia gigantea TaxID=225164 RepID=V3ZB63_LOTGI|nr:hypothetical protein LOTGIDRAFT_234584 [Lottia gigantea]ESO88248.1 hypothetical protein LOTGIDRAFT_234584 [Lottia gigantea]